MKNIYIRALVSDLGLSYKDIAAEIGISPVWLSRLMRYTLSTDNEARIMAAIENLKGDRDTVR